MSGVSPEFAILLGGSSMIERRPILKHTSRVNRGRSCEKQTDVWSGDEVARLGLYLSNRFGVVQRNLKI